MAISQSLKATPNGYSRWLYYTPNGCQSFFWYPCQSISGVDGRNPSSSWDLDPQGNLFPPRCKMQLPFRSLLLKNFAGLYYETPPEVEANHPPFAPHSGVVNSKRLGVECFTCHWPQKVRWLCSFQDWCEELFINKNEDPEQKQLQTHWMF